MYIVCQKVELSTKLDFFDKVRKVVSKKPYVSIKIFISEKSNPEVEVKRFPSKIIILEGQEVLDQINESENSIYDLYKEINKSNYLKLIKDSINENDIIN
jgi:hypothetical protein